MLRKLNSWHVVTDLVSSIQLNLVAYDSEFPDQRATARLIVTVQRNVNGPVFTPSATYQKAIAESFGVGESIIQVSARDEDSVVRNKYRI